MSKFASAVQALIYDRLNGIISCNVYDDVPDQPAGDPDANMPYVVIGSDQVFPFDTDDWLGETYTVELVFWSAYSGKKEVKDLMAEAYSILHRGANLNVSGAVVVDCLHTFSTITSMGANNYVQAIARYRLTITEEL
jgi:hypothetical protein